MVAMQRTECQSLRKLSTGNHAKAVTNRIVKDDFELMKELRLETEWKIKEKNG